MNLGHGRPGDAFRRAALSPSGRIPIREILDAPTRSARTNRLIQFLAAVPADRAGASPSAFRSVVDRLRAVGVLNGISQRQSPALGQMWKLTGDSQSLWRNASVRLGSVSVATRSTVASLGKSQSGRRKWRLRRLPSNTEGLTGLRSASWVRVSTKGQQDNFGPDAQRSQISRAVERYGLIDTGLRWDVAHSGKTIDRTPEWADMLARAGMDYDILVVGYVSRFSRDLETSLRARRELHARGVALYFCHERLLTSDENDWEHWVKEALDGEAWLRKHARLVAEGYRTKRELIGIPGGNRPPYGFLRLNDGRAMAVDPLTMPTVHRCYDLAVAGLTDRQIADRTGLKRTHVGEILTNPVYKGVLRTGEPFALGAVVDPLVWDRAQAQRCKASRRMPGRGSLRTYPLARLIHCAACGQALTADTGRFRHPYPACHGFKAAKPDAWATKPGESYPAYLYDQIVPAVLAHVSAAADLLPEVMSELSQAGTGPDPATMGRIQRDMDTARRQLEVDLDPVAFTDTITRLRQEEAAAKSVDRTVPTADEARAYLQDLPRLWDASGPHERKLLANAVFERVDVLGVERVILTVTDEARRHGWLAAWAGRELTVPLSVESVGYGRGERI